MVRSLLGWCSAHFVGLERAAATRADSVHTVHKMHNVNCIVFVTTHDSIKTSVPFTATSKKLLHMHKWSASGLLGGKETPRAPLLGTASGRTIHSPSGDCSPKPADA
jgi:hypothetical protein